MSKSVQKTWVVALLGLSCVVAFSRGTLAGEGAVVKAKPQPPSELKLPVHIWKRMRTMKRLEKALLTGVKLDAAQRTAVKKVFADLYRRVDETPSLGGFYPRAYPTYDAAKLKKRKDDLKAARKKRDSKLVREIQADIDKHTAGSDANMTPIPEDILPDLAALMKSDQIADYQRIVDHWTALKPRGPFDGAFRMLTRAILDPSLELTPDQLQQTKKIVSDTFQLVRKNRDPENVAKLATLAKKKIMKGFNKQQQAQLNQSLRMFADEMKAVREYANKWYANRGLAVPAHFRQPIPWGN